MPEANDNTSAPPPDAIAADPADPPADPARPPADTAGPAEDAAEADAAPYGGLAWSRGMGFDALLTALSEPAPGNRPVRPASVPPASVPPVPGPPVSVPPVSRSAAADSTAPAVSDSSAS